MSTCEQFSNNSNWLASNKAVNSVRYLSSNSFFIFTRWKWKKGGEAYVHNERRGCQAEVEVSGSVHACIHCDTFQARLVQPKDGLQHPLLSSPPPALNDDPFPPHSPTPTYYSCLDAPRPQSTHHRPFAFVHNSHLPSPLALYVDMPVLIIHAPCREHHMH